MRLLPALLAASWLLTAPALTLSADQIGGTLSATPSHVVIHSQSTIPVSAHLLPTGITNPDVFDLAPGETRRLPLLVIPSDGKITARLESLHRGSGGDTASVTLGVSLAPAIQPVPDVPMWAQALAVAIVVIVLLLLLFTGRGLRRRRLR
jgi:hypothetical protein